jgi:hypothetical protein
MPTTIDFPLRTWPDLQSATTRYGSPRLPAAEGAVIVLALTLLVFGAVANLDTQPLFQDVFQILAAF